MVTKETKDIFAGKYGQLPAPVNPEVAKKVLGDTQPITYRPADDLAPEMEKFTAELKEKGYYEKEEDVLSYAVFEQVAENYFKWRKAQKQGVDKDLASDKSGVYPV